MHRLIYASTATRLLIPTEIQQVLNVARGSNAAAGITGLLIYHEGCFLQVLEGDKDAVHAWFAKIKRDPRHNDLLVMADEAATGRLFSSWCMAFREMGELGQRQGQQVLELRKLAKSVQNMPMVENVKVNAILLAFLSSFRDLELAG